MKSLLAIRHVAFEDLGAFGPVFRDAGYAIQYCDAGLHDIASASSSADLVVVLGGPIGACEEDKYPFVVDELRLLERRLADSRPTLGVCLGAQLVARAMGARVYPGLRKEIGWSPIDLTPEGRQSPLARLESGAVLHWHGDTFDLPAGSVRLASTAVTENQAFAFGPGILALQFHVEVETANFERWLIGHTVEIASVPGLSVVALRRDAQNLSAATSSCGQQMLRDWIAGLPPA
jgi:GMP synthase (glutamine-hydrolysing)